MDTGSETAVVSVGQPAQSGSPGRAGPPLTVGTGLDGAGLDGAGLAGAEAGADPGADAGATRLAEFVGPVLDATGADASAAECALAHPVASAPAATSGAARATARRAATPGRKDRPACGFDEARACDEIRATDDSVLMPAPRFCGTPLRRPRLAHGFIRPRVFRRDEQDARRHPPVELSGYFMMRERHHVRAAVDRNMLCGTLVGGSERAPGSVKLRTGGYSPRPGRNRGWLIRWNSGTDG
jgi:hypothetical protein